MILWSFWLEARGSETWGYREFREIQEEKSNRVGLDGFVDILVGEVGIQQAVYCGQCVSETFFLQSGLILCRSFPHHPSA